MDKLNTLISLNDAKKAIDGLIEKVRTGSEEETDERKLLILILYIIGALVVVGVIAFAVYKHFSDDGFDDYDDLFDDEDPEDLISEDDLDE